ncbi:YpoC family protein [Alkalibacillus silvisoli]|uniref:YpoC-like domain-containing protein n=1 Tax=Alkalibacillus silvisoli TaxID=392823 RepID=A0ABN0ZU66_9BACI
MKTEEIDLRFERWDEVSLEIEQLVLAREFSQTKNHVLYYLDELKVVILHVNEVEVEDQYSVSLFDSLTYIPLNVSERLAFIENRSHHRHGFVQLNELYKEMKKKYAIAKLKANQKG